MKVIMTKAFWEQRSVAVGVLLVCICLALFKGSWSGIAQPFHHVKEAYVKQDESGDSVESYIEACVSRAKYLSELANRYEIASSDLDQYTEQVSSSLFQPENGEWLMHLNKEEQAIVEALREKDLEEQDQAYLERDHAMFASAIKRLSHHAYNDLAIAYNERIEKLPASLYAKLYDAGRVPVYK